MMKRSGKEYRKIEKDIMYMLGLEPTKNSGSGWIEKEDGQSENVLCQLKSTDSQSIKISKLDIDTLRYNSVVSHKIPVFAIQFLSSNDAYLLVSPTDLQDLAKYIDTGTIDSRDIGIDISSDSVDMAPICNKVIKSSPDAREEFREERKKDFSKYKKRKWL